MRHVFGVFLLFRRSESLAHTTQRFVNSRNMGGCMWVDLHLTFTHNYYKVYYFVGEKRKSELVTSKIQYSDYWTNKMTAYNVCLGFVTSNLCEVYGIFAHNHNTMLKKWQLIKMNMKISKITHHSSQQAYSTSMHCCSQRHCSQSLSSKGK